MKEFVMTHQLHHLFIQRNYKGNEIDSLHPISDKLITGVLLQGSLGEVLHGELVPFVPHPSHQISATYVCSVLSSSTW